MSYIFPTFVLAETSDAFMVNSWIQDELLSTIYYTPAELFEEAGRMKAAIRLKRLGKSLIGLSWQQERCMIRVL